MTYFLTKYVSKNFPGEKKLLEEKRVFGVLFQLYGTACKWKDSLCASHAQKGQHEHSNYKDWFKYDLMN